MTVGNISRWNEIHVTTILIVPTIWEQKIAVVVDFPVPEGPLKRHFLDDGS